MVIAEASLVHRRTRQVIEDFPAFRYRYYNPAQGRFLRLDPFAGEPQEPQTLHKYLYANANPVSYTDPSGGMSLLSLAIGTGIRGLLIGVVTGAVIAEAFYFGTADVDDWTVTGALSAMAKGRFSEESALPRSVPLFSLSKALTKQSRYGATLTQARFRRRWPPACCC